MANITRRSYYARVLSADPWHQEVFEQKTRGPLGSRAPQEPARVGYSGQQLGLRRYVDPSILAGAAGRRSYSQPRGFWQIRRDLKHHLFIQRLLPNIDERRHVLFQG